MYLGVDFSPKLEELVVVFKQFSQFTYIVLKLLAFTCIFVCVTFAIVDNWLCVLHLEFNKIEMF